jgi:hypothetical protein
MGGAAILGRWRNTGMIFATAPLFDSGFGDAHFSRSVGLNQLIRLLRAFAAPEA